MKRKEDTYSFFREGFHGDKYLQKLIDFLVLKDVNYFIETGTNVGSTLHYFQSKYPTISCFSCEPDKEAYTRAVKNSVSTHTSIYNETSQDFLKRIQTNESLIQKGKPLFWLDAHSYGFEWPIKEEIEFACSFENCFILIDDFKVPHIPEFGYDQYGEQICSYDYIKSFFTKQNFELYYPNYKEKTSSFHPLRGWGLFVIGDKISFPDEISEFIIKAKR